MSERFHHSRHARSGRVQTSAVEEVTNALTPVVCKVSGFAMGSLQSGRMGGEVLHGDEGRAKMIRAVWCMTHRLEHIVSAGDFSDMSVTKQDAVLFVETKISSTLTYTRPKS